MFDRLEHVVLYVDSNLSAYKDLDSALGDFCCIHCV